MKVERFKIQACCGKTSLIFKTDEPLDKAFMSYLVGLGFIEQEHFTVAGILYVTNKELILTGPFGSNRLQVTCKGDNCTQIVNDFENLLSKLR
jgi:hypothetical protein